LDKNALIALLCGDGLDFEMLYVRKVVLKPYGSTKIDHDVDNFW
jgi:hypothetical protein